MKKQVGAPNKRMQGSYHEQKVKRYLEECHYHILEMNYRCKLGEIDIIAQEGEYTTFIEVKFRSTKQLGYPREAVDWRKQQKIIKVAQWYLVRRGSLQIPCRFDVIEILGDEMIHIKNAFST